MIEPVRRLLPPSIVTQAPRLLWRVHSARQRAAQFYPGGQGGARFSPIKTADGRPVPTLYLASTLDGALMESVFRDVPAPPDDYILDLQRLVDAQLVASCVRVTRRLRLVDLTSKGLKRLGFTRNQIIDTSVLEYARTRALAEHLHHTTTAQGLCWTSKQDDAARAFLLFGDRLPSATFEVIEDGVPLLEAPQRQTVMRLAVRIGITRIYQE